MYGKSIAEFAIANGVTHFITLKPGTRDLSHVDVDRELRPVVGAFLKDYARVRNAIPWRRGVTEADLPFALVVPEAFDRFGTVDPHGHGMIALREGEEALLRGFARMRWGVDKTEGAADRLALAPRSGEAPEMRDLLGPEPVSHNQDGRRWYLQGRRYSPSFDLQPITETPDRIGTYMTKQNDNPITWTHLELFDSANTVHTFLTRTPARRRA